METVVKAPPEAELHLLTDWSEPGRRGRTGRAAVISVLVHIGAIVFIVAVPESIMQPQARRAIETIVTPLIEPLSILTQKEPTKGEVDKEFRATHIEKQPVHAPPGPRTAPPPQPQQAAAAPPSPPKPPQPTTLPEPPKVEAVNPAPKLPVPVGTAQIQTSEEKPKIAFEDVTGPTQVPPGQRTIPIPGPSLDNVMRGALHGGGGAGAPPALPTPQQPASAELPQLLSDSQGVDFRPYLADILASVKRHWYAIMPDAVRQGRTGRVGVQVVIPRNGSLGKVVFVGTTGVPALDNAAIAAISAASPFPPLPAAFKGNEIRVQINFAYNVLKKD